MALISKGDDSTTPQDTDSERGEAKAGHDPDSTTRDADEKKSGGIADVAHQGMEASTPREGSVTIAAEDEDRKKLDKAAKWA